MERHDVLAMMTALKLAGMRAAYDDILATCTPGGSSVVIRCNRSSVRCCRSRSPTRQARSIKYQMASAKLPTACGAGRLRLRRLAGQRAPDPGARRRRLPGGQAQHRPGRRHRHRQDPSRRRHRALLHPKGCTRPVLQRRRPGQPPRGRTPRRTPGPHRRPARPTRLRHPRRARLPALRHRLTLGPAGSCSST